MLSKAETDALRGELLDDVKKKRLIPLVGSGVSRHAKLTDAKRKGYFPSWRGLVKALISRAEEENLLTKAQITKMNARLAKEFDWVAEALRFNLPTVAYERLLAEQYSPRGASPAKIHEHLIRLDAPIILTTNYDTLIEDAYARRAREAADVYTYRQTDLVFKMMREQWGPPGEENRPLIYKIFGTIRQPFDMILTRRLFKKNFQQERNSPADLLSKLFAENRVILLGFSADDVELEELLNTFGRYLDYHSESDYIFLEEEITPEQVKDLEDSNIKPVCFGSPKKIFDFIGELAAAATQ